MTAAGELIRGEIARSGAIPFSRFMELALYAPGAGYYARTRDPFGKRGDFYTAAQLQPVFGRLMARVMREFSPARILDWGGGRGEMREELSKVAKYLLVERGDGTPAAEDGTGILANELFDAIPVDAARRGMDGRWREMRVEWDGAKFKWREGEELSGEWREYSEEAGGPLGDVEEAWMELPVGYETELARMSDAAPGGTLVAIDYGYTAREIMRFPRGSLMGYRRHRAVEDVLDSPGERDITAHVPWTYLERVAGAHGWRRKKHESLVSLLMRMGEADQFAEVLEGGNAERTLQLKTLLFGMGESFQAVTLRRE